jgi:uncharacterized membrane protein YphA (DoxX/SURF4 family)
MEVIFPGGTVRMLAAWLRMIACARQTRWANVTVVNLRIFLGFAFVPAGLKKVLEQPFTDPNSRGIFHEFLHAFHATGAFYQFVGVMQLAAAVLLMSQRFATAGALLALPIFGAVTMFCWSTRAYFTAVMVTLMLLGIVGLLVWDFHKWRGVFASDERASDVHFPALSAVVDLGLWQRCGLAILTLYLAVCALTGGIYRPKGVELDTPSFYVFPALLLIPIVTFAVDQARYRRSRRRASGLAINP